MTQIEALLLGLIVAQAGALMMLCSVQIKLDRITRLQVDQSIRSSVQAMECGSQMSEADRIATGALNGDMGDESTFDPHKHGGVFGGGEPMSWKNDGEPIPQALMELGREFLAAVTDQPSPRTAHSLRKDWLEKGDAVRRTPDDTN